MVLAALPLLFIANLIIWFLRGVVWPVRCKHPATTVRHNGDNACRVWVAGEWSYCRHHNKKYTNSNNQLVDPKLPRWKTMSRGKVVDRTDVRGLNNKVSLLFYHGYARKPLQVLNALPDIIIELRRNVKVVITRIKRKPELELVESEAITLEKNGPSEEEQQNYIAFNEKSKRADQALHILKWLLPITFVVTAASAFLQGSGTFMLEYVALLLLWIVVEIIWKGLLHHRGERDWRLQAAIGTINAFGVVFLVAVTKVFLDAYIMPLLDSLA
jgi:hypothetical protein